MELRVLTNEVVDGARANFLGAYTALGAATPGGRIRRDRGCVECTAPVRLTMANFAADFDPSWGDVGLRSLLDKLAIEGARQSCFRVFRLPGPEPVGLAAALQSSGFRLKSELHMMVAPGTRARAPRLTEARSALDRKRATEFMGRVFFSALDPGRRAIVAQAAQQSGRLFCVTCQGTMVGSVLWIETANTIGVYNLGVHPRYRGQGWGSRMMLATLDEAHRTGRAVALQCDPKIAGFYERLGFSGVGILQGYGIPAQI